MVNLPYVNGDWRFPWAWVARSAIMALIGVAIWIQQDIRTTVDRIEERLREVEVSVPSEYITKREARDLVASLEDNLNGRIDREIGLLHRFGPFRAPRDRGDQP